LAIMASVSVSIPAAGAGKRFGPGGDKIFQPLAGRPVFLRTLELFTGRPDVIQVLLVAAEKDLPAIRERFGAELGRMKVTLVVGGDTRSRSVRNALAKVTDRAELVCVHDAVRPCVSPEWIDRVFAEAARTGAAILACPVHGTLKRAAGGLIRATLPREEFWEAQTPQVFRRELLREAYAGDAEATDDAHLVERLGRPVSLVPGDPRNVKITTPADLAFAEAVIGTLPTPPNARRAGT